MFEPIQNEVAGHFSSGPVCWYPGPETWNYVEQEAMLDVASLGQSDDLLFA
jgi:hypothetical protein